MLTILGQERGAGGSGPTEQNRVRQALECFTVDSSLKVLPLAVVAQHGSQSHQWFQGPLDMDPNLPPSSRLHPGPVLP